MLPLLGLIDYNSPQITAFGGHLTPLVILTVTIARRKLAWAECDLEEDWDICWVDTSINLSRVIRMGPNQVWLACCTCLQQYSDVYSSWKLNASNSL